MKRSTTHSRTLPRKGLYWSCVRGCLAGSSCGGHLSCFYRIYLRPNYGLSRGVSHWVTVIVRFIVLIQAYSPYCNCTNYFKHFRCFKVSPLLSKSKSRTTRLFLFLPPFLRSTSFPQSRQLASSQILFLKYRQ